MAKATTVAERCRAGEEEEAINDRGEKEGERKNKVKEIILNICHFFAHVFGVQSAPDHASPRAKHASREMHAGVGVDGGGDRAQAVGARGGRVPDVPERGRERDE
jgi:hypothetical protein